MAKTKILIVDDEEDVVQALQFRLATAGYETMTARNGADALEIMKTNPVDLVLTDFMMPEINGLELTRRVKENPRWFKTKVVLFSVNAEPEFQKRALELGAADYLAKMNGAGSIVTRVYELLAPEQIAAEGAHHGLPEETPAERSLSHQLRSISEGIVDFLRLARMGEELSPSTQYALDSAEALAEDLHRLASSIDPTHLATPKSPLTH